jgi:endonuclease/exonuclease/phosphatase family metal-dependent hydrolase
VQRLADQAEALAAVAADVVALQEVTRRTLPLWRAALAGAGLEHTACPLDAFEPPGRRRLAVLTAARTPVEPLPAPTGAPWPERVLAARLGEVAVVNVHSPISPSPGLAKVLTHEAVAAALAPAGPHPVVLCGDLNTPRREHPDGSVLTFAHDTHGRIRPERGERWDAAEQALVVGLRPHGYVDAFRALHGYAEREPSWVYPRGGGGYRIDHVLVRGLEPVAAAYAHDWRAAGLSDHSALVVDLL